MKTQQKATMEAQAMTAKAMLKDLLDQRGMSVEKLEAETPRDAVAHVQFPGMGTRRVTAEIADEDSGLWSRDADPSHPYRISCAGGIPIPAAKAESIKESFSHVSFSPDGWNALIFLGEDLAKNGKLLSAAEGKEAVYVLPLSCCLVLHRHE